MIRWLRAAWSTRDEAGVSTVQVVLMTPVLFLMIMTAAQAAIWAHASNVVEQAAQEGAQAGRLYEASSGDAHAAANRMLTQSSGDLLKGRNVQASRGTEQVTVTVSGTVPTVFGIGTLPIRETAVAPVERYVPEGTP